MILVDSSIWIDHLRNRHPALHHLLNIGSVLGHPWVVGELALGQLAHRNEILGLLAGLPQATVATPAEVMTLIEHHSLHGMGIGYVDAQVLAATMLTADASLWTGENRLAAACSRLDLTADPLEVRWIAARRRPAFRGLA